MRRETVPSARGVSAAMVRNFRLFLDPITGMVKSSPPERYTANRTSTVLSGRDVELWPDWAQRFRERWNALSAQQQESVRQVADAQRRAGQEITGGWVVHDLITDREDR